MPVSLRVPSFLLLSTGAAALLVACGGGGGGGDAPATAVSGSVVKGPVSGAEVCAYRATAAGKGDKLTCVTTAASGAYNMELAYEGDVVIEATGGSYTDEATGRTASLATPMQVVVRSGGEKVVGVVTPLTSAAYSVARAGTGGLSSSSFAAAATSVATQFQLTGVNIATAAPAVGGTPNAYGRILRAVSQFHANGGSLATFQGFASPSSLQAAFTAAYNTINGTTLTFTFGGGNSGGGTGTGGGSGTQSCGITVSGSGSVTVSGSKVPFNLPATKICVTGLPTGSCEAGNSQLQSIAASGATPSGDYTIDYQYSYAPGNCTDALATVAYTGS